MCVGSVSEQTLFQWIKLEICCFNIPRFQEPVGMNYQSDKRKMINLAYYFTVFTAVLFWFVFCFFLSMHANRKKRHDLITKAEDVHHELNWMRRTLRCVWTIWCNSLCDVVGRMRAVTCTHFIQSIHFKAFCVRLTLKVAQWKLYQTEYCMNCIWGSFVVVSQLRMVWLTSGLSVRLLCWRPVLADKSSGTGMASSWSSPPR